MAKVPYLPVPSVGPSNQGTPNVQVPTPIDAFGGSVAGAIRSVGDVVDRAGDEIYGRAKALQTLENESTVRDAEAEYIIQAGELRAKYHTLEGKNAVEGLKGYIEESRRLQRDFADRMPNPMSRRLFERSTRTQMSRAVFSAAGHAATQNRAWSQKATEAVITSNEVDVYTNPSPDTFEAGVANVKKTALVMQQNEGWDPKVTQAWEREKISNLVNQRIRGMARNDPVAAKQFYEEHKDKLTPQADVQAQTAVENNLYRVEANRIAATVAGTVPEQGQRGMTRREALDEAERRAKEINDDPRFVQFVRDRTGAVLSQRDKVITDDNRNDMYRLGTALTGGVGGKIPTSLEEMFALDPSLQENWDRARPADRQRIMNQLKSNARGDYAWNPNGDNFRRWRELQGMAETDPGKFLSIDIASEKMPWVARRNLIEIQKKMLAAPQSNPEVSKTYNLLKDTMYPAMQAAGVLPNNTQQYNEFRGALQDALVTFRQTHNRGPNLKETQEIGRTLFREVGGRPAPQTFMESIFAPWSFGSSAVPVHKLEPSDDVLKAFRQLPRFKDTAPTRAEEDDFRREWRRREYKKLFGGSVSSERP